MFRCSPDRGEFPIRDFTIKATFNFDKGKIRLPVSEFNKNFPVLRKDINDCPKFFDRDVEIDLAFVGPANHPSYYEGTFNDKKINIPFKTWFRISSTYLGFTVTCDYGSPTKTADITLTTGKSLRMRGEMRKFGDHLLYSRFVADDFVIPAATKEPFPWLFKVCAYARDSFFDNRGDVGIQIVEEVRPALF